MTFFTEDKYGVVAESPAILTFVWWTKYAFEIKTFLKSLSHKYSWNNDNDKSCSCLGYTGRFG